MAADGSIKLYVKGTVEETGQSYATQDVVEMRKPKLTVTVRESEAWEAVNVNEDHLWNHCEIMDRADKALKMHGLQC